MDLILRKLEGADPKVPLFLYVNIDAIHYPNYFYLEGASSDSIDSHAAALRYVDRELGRLFDAWKSIRKQAFVICCSDHGTCYGEDGCQFHGINHPAVCSVDSPWLTLLSKHEKEWGYHLLIHRHDGRPYKIVLAKPHRKEWTDGDIKVVASLLPLDKVRYFVEQHCLQITEKTVDKGRGTIPIRLKAL